MSDDQVKSIIERVQRLQEEKRTIEDDIKEVYAEARANGYDVKVLRAVVKHLGKDQDELAEFDAIFDLYLQSYLQAHKPSRAHVARDADARTREAAIETAGSAAQLPGKAALTSPGARTPETDHVDRSASAQSHSAEGEPAIPSKAGDAGTGQAAGEPDVGIGQPSGAGTGSAVRAGAPTIKGLAAANEIAARAAQPATPKVERGEIDIEIPAFLRRTGGGNHPSFGEQA